MKEIRFRVQTELAKEIDQERGFISTQKFMSSLTEEALKLYKDGKLTIKGAK